MRTVSLVLLLCTALVFTEAATYQWKLSSSRLSNVRSDLTASTLGSSIFLMGGCSDIGNGCNSGQEQSTVERFDPVTQVLSTNAPMVRPRYRHATVVFNNIMYVIGGRKAGDVAVAFLEAFYPTIGTWAERSPLNFARSDHAAFSLNNKVYVYGGYNDVYSIVQQGEMYDPTADTWTTANVPAMKQTRGDFAVTVYNGKAYATGGYIVGPSNDYICLDTMEVFDPVRNTWTLLTAKMTTVRGDHALLVFNNRLFALGGEYNDGTNSNVRRTVESWAEGEAQFTLEASAQLPQPLYRFGSSATSSSIFIFGGHNAGIDPINSTYVMTIVTPTTSAATSASGSVAAAAAVLAVSVVLALLA